METYLVLILSALCDIKAVKDIHIKFDLDTVIAIGGFQCPAGCFRGYRFDCQKILCVRKPHFQRQTYQALKTFLVL